ncbi:MAG: helix-turn-helix transcriptional regulator [Ruminococcaceae bacterium]|nr:helix-turn-helix transcriptional regulator [Oscillospiraceae bacterium]
MNPWQEFRYSPQKSPISIKKITRSVGYTHKSTHMHGLNELLLISCRANGLVFSNGTTQRIKTPALILHRAGSYHYADTFDSENEGYSCYCIYYDEKLIRQIPEELSHASKMLCNDCLVMELSSDECARLSSLAQLIASDGATQDPVRSRLLLLLILHEAYALLPSAPVFRLNTPNNYIFEVVQYLTQHTEEALTEKQLAAKFHVSTTKLNTDFQRITNQTPKSFSKQIKLSRASDLLASTKLPIAEIAYLCGFSGESYFIQCFGKQIGVTPNAYRKQIHLQNEPT